MVGKKMRCHSMFPQVYAQKWKYQAIHQVTLKNGKKSENTNHLKQHKARPFVFHDSLQDSNYLFFSRQLRNNKAACSLSHLLRLFNTESSLCFFFFFTRVSDLFLIVSLKNTEVIVWSELGWRGCVVNLFNLNPQ